jgi:hypothetical protein
MAHFAKLDENNTVTEVIVVHNNELLDENGNELEQKGIDFCASLFDGTWIQTSYSASIRKNFAGIGFTYDAERNAFIPPKPFASWLLNEDTCNWYAPVEMVDTGKAQYWDEETLSWIEYPEVEQPAPIPSE